MKRRWIHLVMVLGAIFVLPIQASANGDGSQVYRNSCLSCHGVEGKGGIGSRLVGESFIKSYSTLQELYSYIGLNMPLGNPGKLTDEEYKAVAEYLWELNGKNAVAPPANGGQRLPVYVKGKLLQFDVEPFIQNGRTLVPLRDIFEALGASVSWEGKLRKVTASRQGTTIILTIDSKAAYKNGKLITIDQAPIIKDGRTMVPLRFIGEAFDLKVDWDGATRTVKIQ